MPSTLFVKPGQHDVVLMPERNMAKLPPEGALVELTPYWRARLRDGDVTEAISPASAEATAAPAARPSKK
ncbi:phage-like protein [Hyphomicrobium denitrificans ATCC 51888]|uniref:Phage-like protein n=1 Tax=Hyphomicrobium denitrificans (strain ATCC 51888 / DSM 1869 / NCIMB 11706 / TK 0415) TaxID=582899 RepID=D8JWC5_HYPDA|nr:phage-like protein [Hyphomicrobium denitrificans ATCC 51888]